MPLVLHVEDEHDQAELLHQALAHTGVKLEVCTVCDGTMAFRYLQRQPGYLSARAPDLILLDLSLPELGGMAVLRQLKSHDHLRSIPVIVMGCDPTAAQSRDAQVLGAARYMVKPSASIGYQMLMRMIARQLDPTPMTGHYIVQAHPESLPPSPPSPSSPR